MASQRDATAPSPNLPESNWTGLARVVRPTLIAAIGGTGTAAAKAALARIESIVGTRHHYIAARAFDTTFQDNREPRLVDNAEYVYLGGFNAQSVIADIVYGRAFPHWAKWLPPRLNFQQVAFGAGGIRPIGRLCYFYRRDRVQAAIREAITTITDSDLALRFHQQTGIRVNLEAGIDIHLVSSVCGGTGSGIFLDLAFDLRRWAEEHTNREVTVTGHLVLPEAFRGKPVVMKALEANAYVALQELDRYMNAASTDPWTVEYIESRPEVSWRAPFDHCYLLSGLQQGGATDVETLTAVMGEAITVLALSQAGQKVSEGVINMAGQRKSTRDKDGKVCCYSSYGILGLELPEELLGEALGPDLASDLHQRLVMAASDADLAGAEDQQSFKESLRINDFRRVEDAVPKVEPDLTAIYLMRGNKKQEAAAKSELQRLLVEARERLRQERRKAGPQELWDPREMRRFLADRIRTSLTQPGGLDRTLRYLSRCVDTLRDYQRRLRDQVREAEEQAARRQSAASGLEQSSLGAKTLDELLTKDYESWREHLHWETTAAVFQEQPARIEKLIAIVQDELMTPWNRIKGMLENLRLEGARDEESYYRSHRARASVGPVSWFRRALLEPNRDRLRDEVLTQLIADSRSWASLPPKAINAQFYKVCSDAIHRFFRSEAGMTCERLLADCYEYPKEKYKTAVAVLLDRAKANWEMHESYDMRDNKLEISSIGVRVDSPLYQTVQESQRAIQPVDEQRNDWVPIFRSEHGLSLAGLKSLSAYRRSLTASVFEEQRFDFHFFNDRRWVTRLEFAAEEPEEQLNLYIFTAALLLKRIEKTKGKGYRLKEGGEVLGQFRREAFLHVVADRKIYALLDGEVSEKGKEDTAWTAALEQHIADLEEELERADDLKKVTSDRFLSLDIYQIHAEIRAIKNALRIEDRGL